MITAAEAMKLARKGLVLGVSWVPYIIGVVVFTTLVVLDLVINALLSSL